LRAVSSFFFSSVFVPKLGLYLIPLQIVFDILKSRNITDMILKEILKLYTHKVSVNSSIELPSVSIRKIYAFPWRT
jgi:trans-2-enoyl-CoA reductase